MMLSAHRTENPKALIQLIPSAASSLTGCLILKGLHRTETSAIVTDLSFHVPQSSTHPETSLGLDISQCEVDRWGWQAEL